MQTAVFQPPKPQSASRLRSDEEPLALAATHPRYQVPHRAEILIGCTAAAIVGIADLRGAVGFPASRC